MVKVMCARCNKNKARYDKQKQRQGDDFSAIIAQMAQCCNAVLSKKQRCCSNLRFSTLNGRQKWQIAQEKGLAFVQYFCRGRMLPAKQTSIAR
jgi:hypothetical protein